MEVCCDSPRKVGSPHVISPHVTSPPARPHNLDRGPRRRCERIVARHEPTSRRSPRDRRTPEVQRDRGQDQRHDPRSPARVHQRRGWNSESGGPVRVGVRERHRRSRPWVDCSGHNRHNDCVRHDDHGCEWTDSDLVHDWRSATVQDPALPSSYRALAEAGGRLRNHRFADL